MILTEWEILGFWVVGAVSPGAGGGGGGAGVWGWVAVGLVAVGVGIVVAIGVRAQRQISRLEAAELGGGARFASGEVLADVDELSKRLAEELDEKAARLERLIAEADEKIAQLEPVVRRGGGNGGGGGNGEVGRRGELEPGKGDPIKGQVYEMADRGCSVVEIAQSLGQHVGKVELILALRR